MNNKILLIFLLCLFAIPLSSASLLNTDSWDTTANTAPIGIVTNTTYFWITDSTDAEVYQYYFNGTYTGNHWDTAGCGNGAPNGITMNASHFLVVDFLDAKVYVYTHDGTPVTSWDTSASGNAEPSGIEMNSLYIWVTDLVDDKIYRYELDGTYIDLWSISGNNGDARGITMDDTYFWVTDIYDAETYRYEHDGTYIDSWDTASSGNAGPYGITMNNSRFWIVDNPDDKVYEYYDNSIPTTPTLISPPNNSIETASPITLDVLSTDADGDPITYYYYGGTNPASLSLIGYNDSVGGSSFNWSVYQYDEYYWNVRAYDGYEYSDYSDTYQFTAIIPPLTATNLLTNGSFENWSSGPSSPPDGWVELSGVTSAREDIIIKDGVYSVKLTPSADNSKLVSYIDNYTEYRGNKVGFGCWMWSDSLNDGRLYIYDGVYFTASNYHTGSSTWEWVTVTHKVSSSNTQLSARLYPDNGNGISASYFDEAIFVEGIDISISPSPTNGSTIYTSYPPLTYDVPFTWQDVAAPQYKLMVAEDKNFNVLVVNTDVGTDNSVQSLLVNKQYWWKVYSYDGTTYSDSSDIYNFNITGNSTLTGSAIEGVVYKANGDITAISGAEVTIWNSTWSSSMITGSNGYYVFEDLENGTIYNLQAKSDRYLDSSIAIVSAEADPVTNNFYLIDDLTDTEWWHYVEFTLQDIWGVTHPGVATKVYIGTSPTIFESGTTGSDGTITFHLDQNIEYRITFVNSTLGINEETTLYPISKSYTVYIDSYSFALPNTVTDDIHAYITSSRINGTYGYINFTWTDTSVLTTSINYYIHDVDGNELYSTNNSGPDMFDSQIVTATDDRYIVRYVGIHPVHDTIDQSETVVFHGGRRVDFGWPHDWQYAVTALAFLIFIGSMFGARTAHYGAIAVVIFAWIFKWIGWLNETNTSTLLIILAAVIAFGWSLRKSEEVKM